MHLNSGSFSVCGAFGLQGKRESHRDNSSRPVCWLGSDRTTMPFDVAPANCQPDSRPGIFFAGVQTLENDKDPLGKTRIDTNTVV